MPDRNGVGPGGRGSCRALNPDKRRESLSSRLGRSLALPMVAGNTYVTVNSHEVRDSEVATSVGPCAFEPKAACQGSAGEFSDFEFVGMLRPNRFASAE